MSNWLIRVVLRLNEWCRKKPKPKEPKRTVGKLTVTVNNKTLENDPDNALPWELLTQDRDGPEINFVQAEIEGRKEKRDGEYRDFSGLPVFERGKGARPDTGGSDRTRAVRQKVAVCLFVTDINILRTPKCLECAFKLLSSIINKGGYGARYNYRRVGLEEALNASFLRPVTCIIESSLNWKYNVHV